ncbi:MAG: glycosyltransferase [Chitinispirillia bacterium]|nr:glycosyltransferase [Chitinispirillia bacterium]
MSIILIITLAYTLAILFLSRGLYRIDQQQPSSASLPTNNNDNNNDNNDDLTFSIIIAARNEEHNIAACLKSVFSQDLSTDRYEVIVINDRSEDMTPYILHDHLHLYRNLRIITVTAPPSGISPKKHAVMQGIAAAANAVIVFTDADCRVSPTWLSAISKYFNADAALVQGITSYSYVTGMNKMFYGLQSADFLSHGVISAAAIGADLPINSNANNMAFRKKVFEEVGGYAGDTNVTLGDDDHLLQRVWAAGKKIRYMSDPAGAVETAPAETLRALFEQRRRWGSVTVHYGARQVALLSAVFAFYVTIALVAVVSLFNTSYLALFGSLLLVKFAGELVLMVPGTRMFGKKKLRKYLPIASLIQLPMVLAAVLSGVFGKFEWKGRVTARTTR